MKCFEIHKECTTPCEENSCRQWIDFRKDLNCTIIAIANNNEEPMTLRQVAERIGVSFVRIKQIEDKIFEKLKESQQKIQE